MSTRRARIKAVTSLPPRRKNNDNTDKNKPTITSKDEVEKSLKSPKTPRALIKNQDSTGRNSPIPKPDSPRKSPRLARSTLSSQSERIPSPATTKDIFKAKNIVATQPDEVASSIVSKEVSNVRTNEQLRSPVVQKEATDTITAVHLQPESPSPAISKEPRKEVVRTPKTTEKVSVITSTSIIKPLFLSPKGVSSPIRTRTVPTSKASSVEFDAQKLNTPEIVPESPKDNSNVIKAAVVQNEKSLEKSASSAGTRSDVTDDYNVPSVPESVTEDGMDGIVPLQTVASAPKPIALLKNEIISENAEVLFDPIVPLPSPSKVRPKLRPVPRLNPIRRNSIQGSASESEDESRRALLNAGPGTPAPSRQRTESHTSLSTMISLPNRDVTRVRNDSVCSSVSQVTGQPTAPASPHKEKHTSKSRRQDASRRMTALRRRRETVKRDALTMYDLIFYNPSTNPIVPDQDELNAIQANEKVEAIRQAAPEPEENTDDPTADAAPVPQIKLGPNGEIILDEQSLVIKSSDKRKVSSSVLVEGAWSNLGKGRYKRGPKTADWADAETVRFYRALAALGTDFSLMERLFPGRTRRDLKLKFKKEERVNAAQVDKALRTSSKWDATKLEEEFTAEREAAERRAKADAERVRQKAREERERQKLARELRMRQSKAAKALEKSTMPETNQDHGGLTADDFIRRHLEAKAEEADQPRQRRPKNVSTRPLHPVPIAPLPSTNSHYAQLTLINKPSAERKTPTNTDMATILKLDPTKTVTKTPEILNNTPSVPANIESGSLVVLTVNDPKSPSKKMLQTYIAHGGGQLTPVALPPVLLNSVVSYMKKGTPKSTVSGASSPSSVVSHDSRSTTPGVIIPSPTKRQRHSSYTITQL